MKLKAQLRSLPGYRSLALFILLVNVQPALGQEQEIFDDILERFVREDYGGVVGALSGVEGESHSSQAALMLGRAWLRLGNPYEALSALQGADTSRAAVQHEMGTALMALGREREAHLMFEEASRRAPENASYIWDLARSFLRRSEWHEAVGLAKHATELNPTSASFLELGDMKRKWGRDSAAISAYRQAFTLDRRNVSAATNLGNALLDSGEWQKADSILNIALREIPRSAVLLRTAAHVAFEGRGYAVSEALTRRALEYGDSALVDRQALGRVLYMRDKLDQAVDVLSKAFEDDTTHANTAYYLALSLRDSGHEEEALDLFAKVAEMMGQDQVADVHERMAGAYMNLRDYDSALREIELARALGVRSTLTLFNYAVASDKANLERAVVTQRYTDFLDALGEGELEAARSYALERLNRIRVEN